MHRSTLARAIVGFAMVGPFAWWHYVDLTGAVLGLTLVPVGYVLSRSAKGR